MTVTAVNKATGEVIELPASTLEEVKDAWLVAAEYEKAAKKIKDQLKEVVRNNVSGNTSEEVGNYQFRVSSVQRMNYDQAVMREVFDEDLYDTLMRPNKSAVDKYLKENLASLGEGSTRLRKSMIPEGNPYEVIKLEKLSKE